MKLKIEVTECKEVAEHIGFEVTLDNAEVSFHRKYKEVVGEIRGGSKVPQLTPDGEVMTLITSNIPEHILQKITEIMHLYVNGEI